MTCSSSTYSSLLSEWIFSPPKLTEFAYGTINPGRVNRVEHSFLPSSLMASWQYAVKDEPCLLAYPASACREEMSYLSVRQRCQAVTPTDPDSSPPLPSRPHVPSVSCQINSYRNPLRGLRGPTPLPLDFRRLHLRRLSQQSSQGFILYVLCPRL